MNIFKRMKWALPLALAMALVTMVVAFAITVTVDGVRESAWDGDGGQTPGSQPDDDESGIDDRYDISEVNWTNDSTGGSAPYGYLYFLVTSYAEFDATYPPFDSQIRICIDVDNNTGTGAAVSGFCNDMLGVDRQISVNVTSLSVSVRRWTGAIWTTVATPSGGMRAVAYQDDDFDGIADQPYIEVGVDLQSLGITSSASCISTMPVAIYYDNGISDNEDAVPGNGTFTIGCGTPTAIQLANLEAQNHTPLIIGLSALLLVLLSGGALLAYKRSRA